MASLLIVAALVVPASGRDDDRVAGSYLVQLRRGVSVAEAKDIAARHGGRVAHTYHRLGGFAFSGPDSAASRLAADRRVHRVEADRLVRAVELKHLNKMDVSEARDANYDGAGVRIALIDTGVTKNHPVFGPGQIENGKSCVGGKATKDGEGHGTASASNAVGQIGVARDATLASVKVFRGSSLVTSIAKVICGLNWVEGENTNPDPLDDVDVVNMSLAFSGSNKALQNAVQKVRDTGAVVVAAAGNNGGATQAPARFPGVIAVTALSGGTKMASFSARGGDMTAPGVNIRSAENGKGYSSRSGTSRSAPMVAGGAAIVLGEDPSLQPGEVLDVLQASGRCPNGDINGSPGACGGKWKGDDKVAEPLLNAYCAGVRANPIDTDPGTCGF